MAGTINLDRIGLYSAVNKPQIFSFLSFPSSFFLSFPFTFLSFLFRSPCVGGMAHLYARATRPITADPRLNWQQSIELAFKLVEVLKQRAEV